MTQEQEYKEMGLKMMPSGRINHHHWYREKFGLCSVKDSTWSKKKHHHTCCKSRKAYCHLSGCKNRVEIGADDDYSDLKDIN